MNKAYFFKRVRETLFGGRLSATQVDGMSRILNYRDTKWPDMPDAELAYLLATVKHETDHTMQPIPEKGGNAYFKRMYDPQGARPEVAKRLGNIHPGDGVRYKGRGLVQITGRDNYAKFGYADSPDAVMNWDAALDICFRGMILGMFTGKKLADYIKPGFANFVGARWIINKQDQATKIAGYARSFLDALKQAKETPAPETNPVPEGEDQTTGTPMVKSTTVLAQVGQWVAAGGATTLAAIGTIPWQTALVLGGVAILAGGLWIIRERYLKSKREGV